MVTKVKAVTKSEIIKQLSEQTGLTKKEVSAVFDGLFDIVKHELGKKGPGIFSIPGMVKMKVVTKKAVPAGMRMNPFTKEMQMMKAKPARRAVRAMPLKGLKDAVA